MNPCREPYETPMETPYDLHKKPHRGSNALDMRLAMVRAIYALTDSYTERV